MSEKSPRLRMFAGPNGSGKSTLSDVVRPEILGTYINADEIEAEMRRSGFFDLALFGVRATQEEVSHFFDESVLLRRASLQTSVDLIQGSRLVVMGMAQAEKLASYYAAVIADFVRQKMISERRSFTFETVMSSRDKVLLLERARREGYRTYLYYVATSDPEINIARVASRVRLGGHPVPQDKIVERHARSLGLLSEAVSHTDRAYLFDNSGAEMVWVAEVTGSTVITIRHSPVPAWFQRAILDKLSAPDSSAP